MSQVHTMEEIRHHREANNGIASHGEVQANAAAVDLTPLVDDYLAIARARTAWRRLLRWTANLESS